MLYREAESQSPAEIAQAGEGPRRRFAVFVIRERSEDVSESSGWACAKPRYVMRERSEDVSVSKR